MDVWQDKCEEMLSGTSVTCLSRITITNLNGHERVDGAVYSESRGSIWLISVLANQRMCFIYLINIGFFNNASDEMERW